MRTSTSSITWESVPGWCAVRISDANEQRDWRIYADFAQALIRIARPLYAEEDLDLELDNTIYALDASTIDLCLSVFPWALFRSTKSAAKLHTLLDLRGNIPAFIHISNGKLHEVNVLDILLPEAGAFYIMGQTTPANQIIFRHIRECREDSNMDRNLHLCTDRHYQETAQP